MGVSLNDDVRTHLEAIEREIRRVREVVSEITSASEQQAEGVEQINAGVSQMNVITQQTAASGEESAGTSVILSNQAARLQALVARFTLNDLPERTARRSSASPDVATRRSPGNRDRRTAQPRALQR
jgi:uncharacterized phage infection (PIP) family protein YhgE